MPLIAFQLPSQGWVLVVGERGVEFATSQCHHYHLLSCRVSRRRRL